MTKYSTNIPETLPIQDKRKVEKYLSTKSHQANREVITAEEVAKYLDLHTTAVDSYLDSILQQKTSNEYYVASLLERNPDAEYVVIDVEDGHHISTKTRYILDCAREDVEIHTSNRTGTVSFTIHHSDSSESYSTEDTSFGMDWIGTIRDLPDWIVFADDLIEDFEIDIDEEWITLRDNPIQCEESVRQHIAEDPDDRFIIDFPYDDHRTVDSIIIRWSEARPLPWEDMPTITNEVDDIILRYFDGDIEYDTAYDKLTQKQSEYFDKRDSLLDLDDL